MLMDVMNIAHRATKIEQRNLSHCLFLIKIKLLRNIYVKFCHGLS